MSTTYGATGLGQTAVSTREASDPPDEHPISGNGGWPEVDTVRRTAEADWVKRRRRRTSRNLLATA